MSLKGITIRKKCDPRLEADLKKQQAPKLFSEQAGYSRTRFTRTVSKLYKAGDGTSQLEIKTVANVISLRLAQWSMAYEVLSLQAARLMPQRKT
jgi:hypothetical protein